MLIAQKNLTELSFNDAVSKIFKNYPETADILKQRALTCNENELKIIKESIKDLNSSLLKWDIPKKDHWAIAKKVNQMAKSFEENIKTFKKLYEIEIEEEEERKKENPDELLKNL